jgi:hypothetical protein
MKAVAGIILYLLAGSVVYAQKSVPANYFNQKPPGLHAELFAPGIVSTLLYEHSAPAFSPDGKLVVWAVYSGNNYLLQSENVNGVWTKPARPSFNDSLHGYVYPAFSPDGTTLYFSSDRAVPPGYRQGQGNRIWQVKKTETGWTDPSPFDTTASQGGDYAHAITKDGTLYFSSGNRMGTNWNIRRAEKKDGLYTQSRLLPYPLNSRDYEDGAYIAPDETFLIFESQRPEGTNGNLSLFISFQNDKGLWSMPVNMGPKINSGNGERFARLSPDGKYLFFGSFRNPEVGSRGADIYWVDAAVIDELRQTKEANSFIEQPLGDSILAALDRRDVSESTVLLNQWLQLHPGHLDAMVLYSSMLRRQNRHTEAAALFTPFREEWKTNNALVIELALIQFGLARETEAKSLLAPVLSKPMDLRQKYIHLADELFAMQLYDLSDFYFEQGQAIRLQAVALYNRACAYALIDKKTQAFALLNRAIDKGFDLRNDFENDNDLQSLKDDTRWNELQKRLK